MSSPIPKRPDMATRHDPGKYGKHTYVRSEDYDALLDYVSDLEERVRQLERGLASAVSSRNEFAREGGFMVRPVEFYIEQANPVGTIRQSAAPAETISETSPEEP